jgi:hypothetical protein
MIEKWLITAYFHQFDFSMCLGYKNHTESKGETAANGLLSANTTKVKSTHVGFSKQTYGNAQSRDSIFEFRFGTPGKLRRFKEFSGDSGVKKCI